MTLEWIFFDIGDVLFDEDAPHMLYFHTVFQAMRRNGIAVEWDAFHRQILETARWQPDQAVPEAMRLYVPDAGEHDRIFHEARTVYEAIRKPRPYGILLDDITAVLLDLKKDFHLGIIANQHPQVLTALDEYGVGPLFDIKLIDEVVGVSKPDPAIFRMALDQADCAPGNALMVGDRPDVDISPAKTLGMRTVRFRRGILYTSYDPRTDMERADRIAETIPGLLASIRQVASSPP